MSAGRALLGLVVLMAVAPATSILAQNPPAQISDSTGLVFDREVFAYPEYLRRNPFLPLVAQDEAGPRFDEMELLGLVYSTDPSLSVALIAIGVTIDPQGQVVVDPSNPEFRTYRIHEGEEIGNVLIVRIEQDRIIGSVEDFGIREELELVLRREIVGASLPAAADSAGTPLTPPTPQRIPPGATPSGGSPSGTAPDGLPEGGHS